jgi:hypothetical protein
MISFESIVIILTVHFIADFVLQSNWMAQNKSKSLLALGAHATVYTIVLAIISPLWAIVNGIAHFIVYFITSRWTSRLWAKGDTHNFFVVIGLDQLIHALILIYTYIELI